MTEEELKTIDDRFSWPHPFIKEGPSGQSRIASTYRADGKTLVAEVRRLRGLIKDAETEGVEPHAMRGYCPWCDYMPGNYKRSHAPECEAFTESGAVR